MTDGLASGRVLHKRKSRLGCQDIRKNRQIGREVFRKPCGLSLEEAGPG